MRSLATRLLLAFLAVVAVGVLTVATLAGRAADAEFASYVAAGNTHYAVRTADVVAVFYNATRSWEKIDALIEGLARLPQERLLVVDQSGLVVADSAANGVGRRAIDLGLSNPVPIVVDGDQVGSLYLLSAYGVGQGRGRGGLGGDGVGGWRQGLGPAAITVEAESSTLEQGFLDGVRQSLWWAAAAAGFLALTLGVLLTRQIVRPLRLLSVAANRLAAGELSHRVDVGTSDEIGSLAASFNTMAESLERNELARRNLLADVAHELRTPLTVIEGTASAMMDGVYDLTAENVGLIREQTGMLTKLVGDLRELSLAEAGQMTLDFEVTDLKELAERAARQREHEASVRGVRLIVDTSASLALVHADPRRLAQVLGNLLGNALHHTANGGQVIIHVGRSTGGGVMLSVTDTGEGIAAEDLPHIFDRFYRADKSRSRRSGGSGLGLTIARQIINEHGGRIWAESSPGGGATFKIELPEGARAGKEKVRIEDNRIRTKP